MLRLGPRLTKVHTLAFAPDGQHLLAVGVRPALGGLLRFGRVALWNLADPGAEPPARIDTGLDPVAGYWLPDGRMLGVDNRGSWLAVRPDGTDAVRHFIASPRRKIEPVAVTPDGRWLALIGRRTVECRSLPGGGEGWRVPLRENDEEPVGAAFSPGGEVLAVLVRGRGEDGQVWGCRTYDTDTGAFIRWVEVGDEATRVAWSPDGRFLVVAWGREVIQVIDPYTWYAIPPGPAVTGLSALAFHPSGRELLTADEAGRVQVWDAGEWGGPDQGHGRPPARVFEWGVGPVQALAVSPDGALAAVAGKAGVVVWDADV